LDIGGTFTDCVLIDESGELTIAKSPSTPTDFSEGVLNAIESAASKLRLSSPELLKSI
jgi:N-methylhydantoinase A